MVRHAVAVAALIIAAGGALAGCPAKSSCPAGAVTAGPVSETEVADVLRAIEQWRQANEVRSLDALIALYDHGATVSIVTQGVPVIGWDAVLAELTARLAKAKEIHYRLTDVAVAPIGGGAVATGALGREISDGVTAVSDNGTLTLAMGKDGKGAWVIVAEHFSFRRQ